MKQKKYMAAIAVGLSFLLAATGCGKEKDTETVKLTKGTNNCKGNGHSCI